MLFQSVALFTAASSALNIIVNNDDGFGSANIREFYRLLTAAGHNAWIVAPVDNESGQGGRSSFTTSRYLNSPSEYDIIPAGAPSFGTDPNDSKIWYYNGTPAACTFFALDYVVPRYWNGTEPDLLVAGPNFGLNLGPFLYTLSGTMGATYAAVNRDLPAISFSAGNSGQRGYTTVNSTNDPATVTAKLAVALVNQIAKNTKPGKRLLPHGYGLGVNIPYITSATNSSCVSPLFYQTRLTGSADVDIAVYNETSGLFTWENIVPPEGEGANTCINGDCNLPGETEIVDGASCRSSVSVFTIDYDAPSTSTTSKVMKSLQPLVSFYKGKRSKRHERQGWAQTRYQH
ncbi:putative acid phosphatase precursor [Phaeomoniella chlamydospora]|uniref:Putative acid phosphatase n=1 Tax=Phaeomoniella chlamydospora TaxID=158046 RepID=A0A0G2G3E3_PHACM|nr:putative acid phosphatase precursor [Phaeomoniella chlamydospora]